MRLHNPKPQTMVKIHLAMMFVWPTLLIPTLLWWRQSIMWLAFMSLYANFGAHFSAYDSARAAVAAEEQAGEAAEDAEDAKEDVARKE